MYSNNNSINNSNNVTTASSTATINNNNAHSRNDSNADFKQHYYPHNQPIDAHLTIRYIPELINMYTNDNSNDTIPRTFENLPFINTNINNDNKKNNTNDNDYYQSSSIITHNDNNDTNLIDDNNNNNNNSNNNKDLISVDSSSSCDSIYSSTSSYSSASLTPNTTPAYNNIDHIKFSATHHKQHLHSSNDSHHKNSNKLSHFFNNYLNKEWDNNKDNNNNNNNNNKKNKTTQPLRVIQTVLNISSFDNENLYTTEKDNNNNCGAKQNLHKTTNDCCMTNLNDFNQCIPKFSNHHYENKSNFKNNYNNNNSKYNNKHPLILRRFSEPIQFNENKDYTHKSSDSKEIIDDTDPSPCTRHHHRRNSVAVRFNKPLYKKY